MADFRASAWGCTKSNYLFQRNDESRSKERRRGSAS
jgi:hypothetical protein